MYKGGMVVYEMYYLPDTQSIYILLGTAKVLVIWCASWVMFSDSILFH